MTFIVSELGDSGDGSLRWAIHESNARPGLDVIVFDTSLAGGTINLDNRLPDILDRTFIHGPINEQGKPQIKVDFNNHGRLTFRGNANRSEIKNLALENCQGECLSQGGLNIKSANVVVDPGADQLTGSQYIHNTSAFDFDTDTSQDLSLDPLTGKQVDAIGETTIGCTRVIWNDNPLAVLAARSGDWFKAKDPRGASEPRLQVMPRGLQKSGAMYGKDLAVAQNPAKWTARHGSVLVSNIGKVSFEGMNEKGLAAHCLSLPESDYGERDVSKQGLQMGLWVPYILDNAATVEEALSLLERIQIVPVVVDGFAMKVSLSIEDASGDSAVIEYLNGKPIVHHGREYTVTSNSVLETSLDLLKTYEFKDATRDLVIPGNANPLQRFVRGSFFQYYLSKMTPRSITEARAALMSVIRNVSNPIGAPGTKVGLNDETDWRVLSDLTNRIMLFDNPRNLNLIRTDLKRLDFSRGSGVRTLNPENPRLLGNVTALYKRTAAPVPGLITPAASSRPKNELG